MFFKKLFITLIVIYAAADAYCGPEDWTAYARTANRMPIAIDGPERMNNTLKWVADADPQDSNYYVSFEGATEPIVYNGRIYLYAGYFEPNAQSGQRDYTNSQIIAYDVNSGQILWTAKIDPAAWGSWSTPAIDAKHNTVLIGSGSFDENGNDSPGKVYAINAATGAIVWSTQLDEIVVNASICTNKSNSRAFITDCDFGLSGKLYCINLDANGQIIWSAQIGNTCGNTPAYKNGAVYVSTAGDESGRGNIFSFDAETDSIMQLWKFTNPDNDGFFGAVAVTNEGYLYTASCGFSGQQEDNSSLFKIDCNSGSLVWKTPAQATDCVPVVVGNKIYLSGEYPVGICKIKAYQDFGSSVIKLWQTSADSAVGGWDNQPVYANGKLYTGATSPRSYYDKFCILNTSLTPDDPNFITAQYTEKACGSSRAVTYDCIYATGTDGLFKFQQPAILADIDKSRNVDFRDLARLAGVWLYNEPVGTERADLNLDGQIDFADFSLLAGNWCGELD